MGLAVLLSWLDSLILKVFSSLKWFCDSLAVPYPGSGLAAPGTHFPKQELSHSVCGSSAPPRAAPGGFWDWHPVRTAWITLREQSCHGAQLGDKCSAKHREAKTEDVEEKRTFTFFTWRSKINMGTFPRRRACCGVDVKLQLLPVRYLQKHVTLPCCRLLGHPGLSCPKPAESLTLF